MRVTVRFVLSATWFFQLLEGPSSERGPLLCSVSLPLRLCWATVERVTFRDADPRKESLSEQYDLAVEI